jgi:hypothetical protein
MKIKNIYIASTRMVNSNKNVSEEVKPFIKLVDNSPINQLLNVKPGEVYFVDVNDLKDLLLFENMSDKKFKKDKKTIDLIIDYEQNDFISKQVRYKQPNPYGKLINKKIKIEIPNLNWTYIKRTSKDLKTWYNKKVSDGLSGFESIADFIKWYDCDFKKDTCFYCEITEQFLQKIIHNGLLTSKRFPIYNIRQLGRNRGYFLEIDRKDPNGLYSRENCVSACYFCNNDKSDVFNNEEYLRFFQDRKSFLENLLKK